MRAAILALTGMPLAFGAGAAMMEPPAADAGPQASGPRIAVVEVVPELAVPQFGKLEIAFTVNTTATMLHWPYDPAPPPGLPAGTGISAGAEFRDPRGRTYGQPAFHYQHFESAVREGRDWHYATPTFTWRVRFGPNQPGAWQYRLVARDAAGATATEWRPFTVEPSSNRGFVRVSRADPRYFEFDDGTFFTGLGFQVPEFLDAPVTGGAAAYQTLSASGVNFARLWVSSLYGSAWAPLAGGRNRYAGYLPVVGLMPFVDAERGETTLTMRMDYEPAGDTGWFDACRLQWEDAPQAVKPQTRYRVSATYRGAGISGPRAAGAPAFGFVAKIGGMYPRCYEPGTSRVVTGYGSNANRWTEIEGTWFSGNRSFLPKLHLALENVREGAVYVRSVSVREVLADGRLGPEILARPSMEYHLHIPQARAYALDRIVTLAEQYGVYLKLVVMEKSDEIYQKLNDDGTFVTDRDNHNGIYGVGRGVNKTRWLQQAWWRYLQARWGYAPSIHSWELLNEGDPASPRHFELADEFGRFMHYGVFGARPGSGFDHPNDHLVTTSFWHSFPAEAFWANAAYPHVDYADLHAYVSTSFAPREVKDAMQWDAAHYHLWHSRAVAAAKVGKPVVRGEAGLDGAGRQDPTALGVHRDRHGVWLHNFLWAGLDSGGLYELYWWRPHIWGQQGDHRRQYRLVGQFLSELPLNKGGYVDWSGTVSTPALRVVGQKHVRAGRMHLWIQNSRHTWKHVVDGISIEPASGSVRVAGFAAERPYDVEWWDTWAAEKTTRTETAWSDATGHLTLDVEALARDVAVQVAPSTRASETSRVSH